MKLYTEEQVIEIAYWITASHMTREKVKSSLKDLNQQKSLTPIELPSDEEIEKMVGWGGDNDSAINGALWLKEQILNQNK